MNDPFRQAVGDFPRSPLTLRPESTAVLLIDVQNDFCAPEGIYARNGLECPGIPPLLGPLAEFLAASKQSGARLINVRTEYACGPDGAPLEAGLHLESRPFLKEDGLRPGSWGARTAEEEGFSGFDLEIVKVRFSSFFGTDLEEQLRALNIETVILTGVYTCRLWCISLILFRTPFNWIIIQVVLQIPLLMRPVPKGVVFGACARRGRSLTIRLALAYGY